MPRIIKIGAGGNELAWRQALKDLRADDVLLLEPGFYELPQGKNLADVTIKGMGVNPEDTTILGYLSVDSSSRFVNLENLCINTNTDNNTLFIPPDADGYLSLRNCVVKGPGTDTAAIAANGKITLEMYSVKVMNGSVSLFADADFRLEMNDSEIDYQSEKYSALALEGKGTAIINNSTVRGAVNTFEKTNAELDFNNCTLDYVLLRGQTWMNMINTVVLSQDDSCFFASDECWSNIVNCTFSGGMFFDKKTHTIMQNSTATTLIAINQAKLTLVTSQIMAHADFQDEVKADATRTSFNAHSDFEYFLALSDHASLSGKDLILNANKSNLAVKDAAKLTANILASDQTGLEIECHDAHNVKIYGLHWTSK